MFTNKTPWLLLLLLWMGGSTWWHVCNIKQLCGDGPQPVTITTTVTIPGLSITDADKLNLYVPGNVSYAQSGAVANVAPVGDALQKVVSYLNANPSRQLTVTGHYHANELKPVAYPNLGMARAEAIKADLIKLGASAAQMATASVLVADANDVRMPYTTDRDSLYGGLTFAFAGTTPSPAPDTTATVATIPKTEEGLAEAQKFTSVFDPIDLYFKIGKSGYIQTEDTKKFFAEAETYLKANKGKKLMLTGHTDDSGPEGVNLELARARAGGVKNRLKKAGIDGEQIVVDAKGETEPKESNQTPEGRKANRRVTVVVQ